ncbi:GGDEF domain-containing response regulator [Saccharobesus litoralis]|uniref:cyclic-guanylate-specific phosphodiesterase n=1 Tax=Saccharobesus litoralis TaxID=2172099 RepID=A0A2S0VLE7_9ALTE|nr:EAL domain-containing protein [Saccharobesus litoralis]AWB65033.1 GGDEF domain-containing response regulator [Saccharobesus litoralis]
MDSVAKILVVDDDAFNREILSNLLIEQGYDVLCRDSGDSALAVVTGYEPDLILLDIIMPGIDGFEVTRRLKSDDKWMHIPIVLQTALNDRKSCIKGLSLGAEDYITKPIDPLELTARISNLLRLKKVSDFLKYNNQVLTEFDNLTGLPNRSLFFRRLKRNLKNCLAKQQQLGLILLTSSDLDPVNRTHGSSMADLLLKGIAQRLQKISYANSFLSYIGNGLFTIIVEGNKQHIQQFSQLILLAFDKPLILLNQEIFVKGDLGIAMAPDDSTDAETLLRRAEIALNSVKQQALHQELFFVPAMDAQLAQAYSLEQDLHRAINHQEFILNYQPKVDLHDGSVSSAESLIRWLHPTLGLVSPAKFIPIAESSGLILPITRWVLNEACMQAMHWQLEFSRPIKVAVNISGTHFQSGDILSDVQQALSNSGLAPHLLELEITENIMMDDFNAVLTTLEQLSELGVLLSIDDFGTGYSSLKYLQHLPVNRIKIDQSFVKNIINNAGNAVITKSVIAMSHQFGFSVVAEGVETSDELNFLLQIGCDTIQGYYFSKPLPVEKFDCLLASNRSLTLSSTAAQTSNKTLLILCNNDDWVQSLSSVARSLHIKVLVAKTDKEAMQLLNVYDIQVLFMATNEHVNLWTNTITQIRQMYPHVMLLVMSERSEYDTLSALNHRGDILKFYLTPCDSEKVIRGVCDAFELNKMMGLNQMIKVVN